MKELDKPKSGTTDEMSPKLMQGRLMDTVYAHYHDQVDKIEGGAWGWQNQKNHSHCDRRPKNSAEYTNGRKVSEKLFKEVRESIHICAQTAICKNEKSPWALMSAQNPPER
ncbi:hypothetical protein FRC12_012619, partial [Ceratobasidium sp. 428]